MQINCIVPESANSGNLGVVLTVGNSSSPVGVMVSVR
jgi:uncharacterized protein (TIGR03437 family)